MEKILQQMRDGTKNRLLQVSGIIILFIIMCISFSQYIIYDISFSIYTIAIGITVLSIVSLFLFLLVNKYAIYISFADILLVIWVIYSIYRYDFDLQLANWRIEINLLLLAIWFSLRFLFNYGLLSVTGVIWVFITMGCIQSIWGGLQLYDLCESNHTLYKITGSFFNPGPYSGYIAMVIPIVLYQYFVSSKIEHVITLCALLVMLCILPAGMSRAAWLSALVASLIVTALRWNWFNIAYNYYRRFCSRFWVCFGGTFCILIILVIGLFCFKKKSAYGRIFIWKNALHIVTDNPWLGQGTGGFFIAYSDTQSSYFQNGEYSKLEEYVAGEPEHAFNEYIQMVVEGGIIQLILFVSFVTYVLKKGFEQKYYGICGGIISLLIFAFFSYPFQLIPFPIAIIVLLVTCIPVKRSNSCCNLLLALLFICFSAILSIFISFYQRSGRTLSTTWENCRFLKLYDAPDAAINGYNMIYSDMKHNANFIFEYAYYLSKLKKYDESNALLHRATLLSSDAMVYNMLGINYQNMGLYVQAEYYFLYSTYLLPNRIYPYYLLAKLYATSEFYYPDKMNKMVEIVLTKEPKVYSKAIDEMKEELLELLVDRRNNE